MAAPLLSTVLSAGMIWGQTQVGSVRLDLHGVADPGEMRAAFGVTEGEPLSRNEIRAGVQALMATGRFEDVVVSVEDSGGGAAVVVTAQLASRVESVSVTGLPRKLRREVLSTLGVARGRLLLVAPFEGALEQARADLRSKGYPGADLEPDLVFDTARGTVRVTVAGRLGPPLILRDLQATGCEVSRAQLLEVSELELGEPAGDGRLQGARRRLAEHLRRQGLWEAEVSGPDVTVSGDTATAVLSAAPGPAYRLDLRGLKDVDELEDEALPFLSGSETFAEAALDATVQAVRQSLQRKGYLLATAVARMVRDGEVRVLVLEVQRGPRTPIEAVRFLGGDALAHEMLEDRIGAFPGRPWRWGREPVDEQSLEADVTSLLATFQEHGYAEVSVAAPRVVPEGKGVAIEFPVDPGARFEVASLDVVGIPAAVALPGLPLALGGPWSQLAEERSRAALLGALQNAGYADARLVASHTCAEGRCAVRLEASPGEEVLIDRIVVAGLDRTRRTVLDAALRIKPGEPVGPTGLLEAQRRLLGLGIFNEVKLDPVPGQDSGPRRGMRIRVVEAPSRAYSFGLGWDTESKAQISATWAELSLFGSGRSLSFEGRFSSREVRYQVSYREPAAIGILRVPAAVSVFSTEEHNPSYDLSKKGMWFEVGNRLRRPFRPILRLDYQITEPTAASDEILSDLERDEQEARISSLTPSVEWDTRDDMFTPNRGVYLFLAYQTAFKVLQADSEFDKVVGLASGFLPLGGGTLAANVKLGTLWPRNVVQKPPPDAIEVPVAVRFFAGGRVSHRAFPTDGLGIPGYTLSADDGSAIGGGGLLLTNLEWRFKVYGPVGVSVFVDGGNVWREVGDILLGDMRWGGGLGVRVETPVGPFRLEYGWKLDRRHTFDNGSQESPGELFISFGNPF